MRTRISMFVVSVCATSLAGSVGAATISAGTNHSLAVKADGTVWAWGDNTYGQLGDGTTDGHATPVQVEGGLSDVHAVVAARFYSLALKSDGTVWTWGLNTYGQLGHGTTAPSYTPSQVLGSDGVSYLEDVVAITAGVAHVLALKEDGTVWAWGMNDNGQLGDNTVTQRNLPVQVWAPSPGSGYLTGITAVSTGGSHSLALKSDGTVWSWGQNTYGQLANGGTAQKLRPTQVLDAGGGGFTSVARISAGGNQSLATKADGTCWGWGSNNHGELGQGTTDSDAHTAPVQVKGPGTTPTLTDVVGVEVGDDHVLAWKADGTVWAWGSNGAGRLGDGTATQRTRPVQVLSLTGVVTASAGQLHSLGLQTGGALWAWGSNNSGRLGDGSGSASSPVPVAVSGTGWKWQTDTPSFSPGAGTQEGPLDVTVETETLLADIHYTLTGAEPTLSDAAVASGGTITLDQNLTVKAKAWAPDLAPSEVASAQYTLKVARPTIAPTGGTYSSAQTVTLSTTTPGAQIYYTIDGTLPTESSTEYTVPFSVETTTTVNANARKTDWVTSDTASETYVISFGQLDPPTISPAPGTYAAPVDVTISAAAGATIHYTLDGSIPTIASPVYSTPIHMTASTVVKAIAAKSNWMPSYPPTEWPYDVGIATPILSPSGGTFTRPQDVTITCATKNVALYYNDDGEDPLGDPLHPPPTYPTVPQGGVLKLWRSARLNVRGWSWPEYAFYPVYSEMASGTFTFTSTPALVAGAGHSVLLKPDGTVWTWGRNDAGQLGDGTTSQRSGPVLVDDAFLYGGATAVAAGAHHTLALRRDGTVWAWGSNDSGQLGDGTTAYKTTPTQVSGLEDIEAIAAGASYSLAVKNDGTVWAWGGNNTGQLGNGTTTPHTTPVQVNIAATVAAVSAGLGHVLAVTNTGAVWAWGDNSTGQLGDGTTVPRPTPFQVPGLPTIASVAAGGHHSLAVTTAGAAWAWGSNVYGQLGSGVVGGTWLTPATTAGAHAFQKLSAGENHSVGLEQNGSLWGWGANGSGQLGLGTTATQPSPVQVPGVPGMSIFGTSVGPNSDTYAHTLAATADGTVWTWGLNDYGQLGDDTTTTRLQPYQVSASNYIWRVSTPTFDPPPALYTIEKDVVIRSATAGSVIRYTTDGSVPTESHFDGQFPSGGTVKVDQTMTLSAVAWRAGRAPSDLATGNYTMDLGTLPPPTVNPPSDTYVDHVDVVMELAAGAPANAKIFYTINGVGPTEYTAPLRLESNAAVEAYVTKPGWTTSAVVSRSYAVAVADPTLSLPGGTYSAGTLVTVQDATPGATIHYTENGADPTESDPVIASGNVLLLGTYTLKVKAWKSGCVASDIVSADYQITGAVAGGEYYSLALKPDGTVWAWGNNLYGRLGDGTYTQRFTPVQVRGPEGVSYLTDVAAIAASMRHSLALKNDGTVWAWGDSSSGQVGDEALAYRLRPVQVHGPEGVPYLTDVVAIAAGWRHSLAVKSDGTVWAWGYNASGQVGDETQANRLRPVQVHGPEGVPYLTDVVAIAAGMQHSLAVKSDGTVWAWGDNYYGQLGDGSAEPKSLIPVQVAGLAGVAAVTAGDYHGYARGNDGIVWAWGFNNVGQLGDGTYLTRRTAVRIGALANVTAITTGNRDGFALEGDGSVWTWGFNQYGELGDGTVTYRSNPLQVLTGMAAVGAGVGHGLTVDANGGVWAWGDGDNGQVGDGTTSRRHVPTNLAPSNFDWRAGTPVMNPTAGTFATVQTVSLSTVTSGATIYYSTDGSEPTTQYTTPIPVNVSTLIKAKAVKAGMPESNVASAQYTLKVATPAFDPGGWTYPTTKTVTITCATTDAEIHFTTDGSDPTPTSTRYTVPVSITTTTTLKARAFKTGWTDSDVASATYTLTLGTLAAPTLTPSGGTYPLPRDVTMTALAGATICYTTNGSNPTPTYPVCDPLIPITITLTANTTLKAQAYHPDYAASPITTETYEIKLNTPTISLASGTYDIGQAVTLTSPDPDVTIRYTLDGSDPTSTSSGVPSETSLWLMTGLTLKAAAFKTGNVASDIVSAVYTVTGSAPVVQVGAGENHSLLVGSDGSAWVWGRNAEGQLGDGGTTQRPSPVQVSSLDDASAVAAGFSHSLAVMSNGIAEIAYAWGNNSYGKLGDGTTTTMHESPWKVKDETNASAVSAGYAHSLRVNSDGTVSGWGYNGSGQMGDGTTTQWSSVPKPVVGDVAGASAVSAGYAHSLALKSDGTVLWAWGANTFGQLGVDPTTTTQTSIPVTSGMTSAVAIAAGQYHSLAAKSNGIAYAWGNNNSGQLGDDTIASHFAPAPVHGLTGVLRVAAGAYHSVALRKDGTVWAWGANGSGQLGDGTTTPRRVPVRVLGLSGIVAVAAGSYHNVAVGIDGTVWTWGHNYFGQLGDGTTLMRTTPVALSDPAYAWKVATPTLSVGSGTYHTSQTVVIATNTSYATLHYTTNGLDPTESDPTIASGASYLVDTSLTLKVKAWKAGMPPSDIASATYVLAVDPPTITPWANWYEADQYVSITTSAGPSATIRYTQDGTDPTESSTRYTDPIPVTYTQTIKAKGWRAGWTPSLITSRKYTMRVATPAPTLASGPYTVAQSASATVTTSDAKIHYTTNGQEPTLLDLALEPPPATIPVDHSMTVRFKAWRDGWTPSDTGSATYVLTLGTTAAPTFDPPEGTYTSSQSVVLTSATAGAIVRYTLDGTEPTFRSPAYTLPLTIDETTTIKAKAFAADMAPSTIATATYTLNVDRVAMPQFSPAPGRYTTAQVVTVTCSNSSAAIHYTKNGLEPTESDLYVTPGGTLTVTGSTTLKAKAFASGMTPSAIRSGNYHITGAIAAGGRYSLTLKSDATVWGWGTNGSGQLGNGSTTASTTPVQVLGPEGVPYLTDVIAIAAGTVHSLAVKSDGTAWAWGYNNYGQLGNGTLTQNTTPVKVDTTDTTVLFEAVSAGMYHSLGLSREGKVYGWGYNVNGQAVKKPVATGLSGVVAIATGYYHNLAVKSDGTVSAWGYNGDGQLGDGTTLNQTTPVDVPGLNQIVAIAAGGYHSFALRADGSLWAWGRNSSGELGDGTTLNSPWPIRIAIKPTAVAVACGESHSLLLRQDATGFGDVHAWGQNNNLQVGGGAGVVALALLPRPVVGVPDSVAVSGGSSHSLALAADGAVWVWGYDTRGTWLVPTTVGLVDNSWLTLVDNSWLTGDPDNDGLTTIAEWRLGTDPLNADSNGDGLMDGLAVKSGKSATNMDMDGDGVLNAVEIERGTNPFDPDTDHDGVLDGVDCFPLDPSRSTCPQAVDGDTTPPTITLQEPGPLTAQLISSVPVP